MTKSIDQKANAATLLNFADISPGGQVRLLDMSYGRIVFGFSMIPVVAAPFIIWLYQIQQDAQAFLVWAIFFTGVAVAVRIQFHRYKQDCTQLSAEQVMRQWLPKVHALAIGYGLSLSMPFLIMATDAFPFLISNDLPPIPPKPHKQA